MRELGPVLVVDLFPELNSSLIELLRSLSDADWQASTVCEGWSVKDLALHLLGDEIGNLSRRRDGFVDTSLLQEGEDLSRWPDLVRYVNRLNELWVQGTRRLSPRLLCDLLAVTSAELHQCFKSLDPFALGSRVSWAGPEPALVWLDIAREYTERWLHQQQIRDATGRPALTEPKLFAPVLDTFVRALPHTYRDVNAPEGTYIALTITGASGGTWCLARDNGRWLLAAEVPSSCAATITIDQDVAWRLFTKGVSREQALAKATLAGDQVLAARALDTVSIIA